LYNYHTQTVSGTYKNDVSTNISPSKELRHREKLFHIAIFIIFASMKQERKIIAFKHYYREFMQTLNEGEQKKIHYVFDMLATQERISAKFVKFI
jgi:hypothetical protein